MGNLFNASNDPLAVLGQDTSAQRSQLAQYNIIRAATYLRDKRNDDAIKEFKKALAFDPQNETALTYIGKLNLANGNNLEAIKAFKTLLRFRPNMVETHVNLANAYIQNKQYTESEKELKAAARLDPMSPLADYTLGLQYSNTGRLAEAEKQFLKVQKVSRNDGNVFYALGMVYNKQGRSEEAVKSLEKALALKPKFPEANYELGIAYNALGRTEDAQKQLTTLQGSNALLAKDLKFTIEKPAMSFIDSDNSRHFDQTFGAATPLWMLDPTLFTPNASTQVSVAIQFTNEMDVASVMNLSNWNISRAASTEGGYYTPQLGDREVTVPPTPAFVSYNPVLMQANVTFNIKQNAAGNATIDPSHLVFKFTGKDADGRSMDSTADQIDGYSGTPF
ncbi:MAG: tetratricopeptide repeat protein [Desulfuromonadales bacterium]